MCCFSLDGCFFCVAYFVCVSAVGRGWWGVFCIVVVVLAGGGCELGLIGDSLLDLCEFGI